MKNYHTLTDFQFDPNQLLELLKHASFDHYDYYFLGPDEVEKVSNILNIKNIRV